MKPRLFLLALLLAGCTAPLPQRVDYPRYGCRSCESQEIVSVERTDTATIFHFKSFYIPGWWIKVSSDTHLEADGKRYALLRTEGITPDEELTMGEDGTACYTLFFEPLPAHVKTVDYIEGETIPNGFRFYGIDLTGREMQPGPLPGITVPDSLPVPSLEYGEAVLEIIPTGDARRVQSYVSVQCQSYLCPGFSHVDPAEVRDNVIRYHLKLYGTGEVDLLVADFSSTQPIPVSPGETLRLYLDASNRATTRNRFSLEEPGIPLLHPEGRYAFLYDLNSQKAEDLISPYRPSQVNGLDLDSVHDFYDRESSRLYQEALPPAIQEYAQNNLKDVVMQLIRVDDYVWRNNYKKLTGKEADGFFRLLQLSKEELAWLRDLDLNNPKTLLSVDFSTYEVIPALAQAVSADTTGIVREYARFAPMLRSVRRGNGFPDGWDKFKHPVFSKKLHDEKEAFALAHAEIPECVKEIPEVQDDKLLGAILAEHTGRPVVVDIWATWCGPCLAGIKALEPLKTSKYADVDFVYLAGENSRKTDWLAMIPDIRGDHYYLTDRQLKVILNQLKSEGYPTYFVVGRNGMNGSVLVGFNEDKLKNLIDKARR